MEDGLELLTHRARYYILLEHKEVHTAGTSHNIEGIAKTRSISGYYTGEEENLLIMAPDKG